jgi:glycerol-3-phosphate dehydrogenase
MRCAARCGQIVAQELSLPPREGARQAMQFLSRQAMTRAVALGPEQARQEALAIASVRSELGAPAGDEAALSAREEGEPRAPRPARDLEERAWRDRSS